MRRKCFGFIMFILKYRHNKTAALFDSLDYRMYESPGAITYISMTNFINSSQSGHVFYATNGKIYFNDCILTKMAPKLVYSDYFKLLVFVNCYADMKIASATSLITKADISKIKYSNIPKAIICSRMFISTPGRKKVVIQMQSFALF